jgi:hypothetical protein
LYDFPWHIGGGTYLSLFQTLEVSAMVRTLRLACLVLWVVALIGVPSVVMAADDPVTSGQATPSATPEPVDPTDFYADVMSGKQDGMVVLWIKDIGFDIAVHCLGGMANFATWIEINGDLFFAAPPQPVSCERDSLLAEFPGSDLIVRDDPKQGWVVGHEGKVSECHGSALVSVWWNQAGFVEATTDFAWPSCAGNPVG